jgi:SAM-dependent methyltransferase
MAKKLIKYGAPLCPACGKKENLFWRKKNNCDLYRCENCASIFVWPIRPDYSKIYQKGYFGGLENYFGYADYDGDKEIMLENFGKYLAKLNKFRPEKGKLLDVGAATGNFVELARSQGWSASGIEMAEEAAEIGRKKNLHMRNGDFETYDFSESNFDILTFWDVLEHFSKPEDVLSKANGMLKQGGLIAINTPDPASLPARLFGKRWHLIIPPEHLVLFSKKGLEIFLKKNGFNILYIGRVGKKFSLRYIFKILANWQKLELWKKIAGGLSACRLGKLKIPINTRDNLFIIAQKKNANN